MPCSGLDDEEKIQAQKTPAQLVNDEDLNTSIHSTVLSQDESFLQEVNVEFVEKEYWTGKTKKAKLECDVSLRGCSSPELFEDDDLKDFHCSNSFVVDGEVYCEGQSKKNTFKPQDNTDWPANDKTPVTDENINKGEMKTPSLSASHKLKDLNQPPLSMKDKIKLALLNNARKGCKNVEADNELNIAQNHFSVPTSSNEEAVYFEVGPFYGLPSKVEELIQKSKGIKELYSWQEECLSLTAVRERKNLVYSLPTSGGKTLVSEILMLRELLLRRKNVIFVLPYVSIVQEKVRSLAPFGVDLGFLVEEYAAGKGTYPPRKRRRKQVLFIATIEKAHGLLNSLIEEGRLSELGLVVVDELHLVGEAGGRGAVLESFLTKILFSKESIHVVGMSATIGNLNEIAAFLKAEIFCNDFRPVELKEYVKYEDALWAVNRRAKCPEEEFQLVRKVQYNYTPQMLASDPDQLSGLVAEVIPSNSCLIFCPTKKNCENVAVLVCRFLPGNLLNHKVAEKLSLYKALVNEGNGSICPVLKKILPFGLAYHHSGLTGDERRLIEEAYRVGTLCCICCTSTLAAGVNLPAKRVILRSPYIGNQLINLSRYKQMIGRAGRAGFDSHGESILICQSNDREKVKEVLKSKMDEANSGLCESDGKAAENLVLSAIGLGLANTRIGLQNLFNHSLLNVQAKRLGTEANTVVDKAIARLLKIKMLSPVSQSPASNARSKTVVIGRDTKLTVSKLGKAAIKGSIDIGLADELYKDLRQAQSGLVLLSDLHLLYVVTPYDIASSIKPIPNIYYNVYMKLNPEDLQTAYVLGISEACMIGLMTGKNTKGVSKAVLNRFYVTLMLRDLWNQMSVWEVSRKFDTNRGIVQSLMNRAASFSSNVLHFCQEFEEFWAFRDMLVNFSKRLSHCCHAELLPLMDLPAVKRGRARQLYNAGFKTLQDVANSTPQQLVESIDHLPVKVARQIIAAAKLILLEKVETLREEAEDVMDGLQSV
ncbi:helicase POLQ-like [Ischnura elegans]|uniref:helicase POLQ-like n=1 Tax=Ischnura elegans TaxID=197161 RepID=UPI001ED86D59|nr:helicase POLQ-like [Ischnura elegans]